MTEPYAERQITLTFEFGEGSFGGGGQSALTLAGLRVLVQVELANLPSTGMAQIRVYGMTRSHMNQLSKAGLVWEDRKNNVRVEAGDAKSGMATVFYGNIFEAYPEMTEAPNSAFVIIATPASDLQLKPVKPVAFPGATDAATALTSILQGSGSGLTLENNGVNVKLASPYFAGTAWSQILRCIRAADCFAHLDRPKGVLAIWPKKGSRSGGSPVISAETGMIGYPSYQQTQVIVRTLFDPSIKSNGVGNEIQIKSIFDAANGKFSIIHITYNLASQLPNGPWEMVITANPLGK
jgi:hypothetical protein